MSALVSNNKFGVQDCNKSTCPYCTYASDYSIWDYQGMTYTDLIREFHKDDADSIIIECVNVVNANDYSSKAVKQLYNYGCYMKRYVTCLLEESNSK